MLGRAIRILLAPRALLIWLAMLILSALDDQGRVDLIRSDVTGLPTTLRFLVEAIRVSGDVIHNNPWGVLVYPVGIVAVLFLYVYQSVRVMASEFTAPGTATDRLPGLTDVAFVTLTHVIAPGIVRVSTQAGGEPTWTVAVGGSVRAVRLNEPPSEIIRNPPVAVNVRGGLTARARRLLHGLPAPQVLVQQFDDGRVLLEGKNLPVPGWVQVSLDVYHESPPTEATP